MAFTDRSVEFPGRVELTNVSGDIYDVTAQEGAVYTEGTLLNATNLNKQTQVDSAVETALNTAGMTSGTYDNVMSDALKFLLDGKASTGGVQTSGSWLYIVLGGMFFCMYSYQNTIAINTAVGNVYQSASSSITYPISLTAVQYANVAPVYSSYGIWATIASSSTSGFQYNLMSALSRSSATYRIKVLVIGTV